MFFSYFTKRNLNSDSSIILFKYDTSNNEWKQANKTRIISKSKHTMIGKKKGTKHIQQTKTPATSYPMYPVHHLHNVTSVMVWVSFYFYFELVQ